MNPESGNSCPSASFSVVCQAGSQIISGQSLAGRIKGYKVNIIPENIKAEKEYWTRQMNDGMAAKHISYESKLRIVSQASTELTRIDQQLLKLWEKQR